MPDELEYLRARLATAEKAYTLGHEYALKTHEHIDRMLTWAIGLMGAGLYSSYGLLGAAASWARLWALAPWILGVLCALAGRIILARILSFSALGAHARNSMVLLLMLETDVSVVKKYWKELTESAAFFDGEKKAKKLQPWANSFYTLTHLLFGVGVIAVVVALAVYGPGKPAPVHP